MNFAFQLLTTQELCLDCQQVEYVSIPAVEGEMTIYSGHMPVITEISSGIVSVADKEGKKSHFVSGGFAHVTAEKVYLLAEKAASIENYTDLAKQIVDEAKTVLAKMKPGNEKDELIRRIAVAESFTKNR